MNAAATSEETLFRSCADYGEPNDPPTHGEKATFYFSIESIDSCMSGFVTRSEFNFLAARLGLPALEDVKLSAKPKPLTTVEALKAAQKRLEKIDDNTADAVELRLQIGAALEQAVRW